ncbi:chromosome transmission fidelity protein 18 homolog [Venturia canescens]|uniref:chromosome transmission fidelity protein 18 homolog n=1 Tax=Venturia canescens TaxID=32260 RepID=UPI001C9CD219|nr:chromosome transmission fidelity protein 18 homolog [Venturia canescens]
MDEFPDPDEEFDLIVDQDQSPAKNKTNNVSNDVSIESSTPAVLHCNASQTSDQGNRSKSQLQSSSESFPTESTRKRTYEELLQDFGDIFTDDVNLAEFCDPKDKRPRWSEPEAVIELILKERKKNRMVHNGLETIKSSSQKKSSKDSISTTVPSWNFIALTRVSDFQRVYVRVGENRREKQSINTRPPSDLFQLPFSDLKREAEEIILKNAARASSLSEIESISKKSDDQLWVDKYRPRTYMELLTDESVNRACLRWLKLWDKVVFNREITKRRKKPVDTQAFGFKNFGRKIEDEGVDARGFPIQRIALLSGPPGLGKTTLAHLVAKHAGYNIVEINASDERGPEAFREALLAATEMRSLIGDDPKPNCLILDEIDGASAASIELLIKYVQGKLLPKGRKNKEAAQKNKDGCKRPVICICNEAYTPSLKPLRGMAFVITVPKIHSVRLADRLAIIARKEKLKTDQGALLQLAERSGCDIRSCLCALQYMGEACSTTNFHLGLKDTKRGLFDCWKDILQVPLARDGIVPIKERVQVVLKAVYSGETERTAQGVFHNYPEVCVPNMNKISETLQWYEFYDEITNLVLKRQDWRVMPYANYAFVAFHFGFANNQQFVKLNYPYAPTEANQKLSKTLAMLTATKQSYNQDIETLALDITPFLPQLLTPKLRSVSGHLYSPNERADLTRLINVLLELGLSFVHTKSDDRSFDYTLDPNLLEIGILPDCKLRRSMPYAVKQIVAQELEIERVRRAEKSGATGPNKSTGSEGTWRKITRAKEPPEKTVNDEPVVPNHLRQLKPKSIEPKKNGYINFFEKFVPKPSNDKQKSPGTSPKGPKPIHRFRQILIQHGVWYKYKEGFSNSVRREVKMADLL